METRMNASAPAARTTTAPRKSSPPKGAAGWKIFIMAASLAATIGGWGILAVDQGSATAQAAVVQPAAPPQNGVTSTRSSRALRQVTGQAVQPQTVTRTRSSR